MIIPAHTLIKDGLTVSGDTDLKAENIKNGVNIFGVTGSLDPSSCEYGSITPTSNIAEFTVSTNLKTVSKVLVTSGESQWNVSTGLTSPIMILLSQTENLTNYKKTGDYAAEYAPKSLASAYTNGSKYATLTTNLLFELSDGKLTIKSPSTSFTFASGVKYKYEIFK